MDAERVTRLLAEGRITQTQIDKAAILGLIPAQLATNVNVSVEKANLDILRGKALAAITSNTTDITQDTAIKTQADVLSATTGTRTGAQLSNDVRALAQAVSILASNDSDAKKELTALIRLVLSQTTDTTGT